jgi:hypothetical protein
MPLHNRNFPQLNRQDLKTLIPLSPSSSTTFQLLIPDTDHLDGVFPLGVNSVYQLFWGGFRA